MAASTKGLPADHPDSFEARYQAKPENLTGQRRGVGQGGSRVYTSEPETPESIMDGFGDNRMSSNKQAMAPAVAKLPPSQPADRPRRKLFRVTMQLDSGTFTTPAVDMRVCEFGVMLVVPDRDDLALFVPAPATTLKLSAPGQPAYSCYFPGTYFPAGSQTAEGGQDGDHILVFIREGQ